MEILIREEKHFVQKSSFEYSDLWSRIVETLSNRTTLLWGGIYFTSDFLDFLYSFNSSRDIGGFRGDIRHLRKKLENLSILATWK